MMPSVNMDKSKAFISIWIEKLDMLKDMLSLNTKIINKPNQLSNKWMAKKSMINKSLLIGLSGKNPSKLEKHYEIMQN